MSVKTLIETRNAALVSSILKEAGIRSDVDSEYEVEPKQMANELLKLATGKSGQPGTNEEDTGLIFRINESTIEMCVHGSLSKEGK